ATRATVRTCNICGTQLFASATPLSLSHSLPPSEIKSLYGSITRSAVISFSYVTFAMLPPGYAVPQVDQRVLLSWYCQRLPPSTESVGHLKPRTVRRHCVDLIQITRQVADLLAPCTPKDFSFDIGQEPSV